MKPLKLFSYLVTAVILVSGIFYGYIVYKNNEFRKQLSQAKDYCEKGNVREAIALLEELYGETLSRPRNRQGNETVRLLAGCYFNAGRLDEAEELWAILQEDGRFTDEQKDECVFQLAYIAEEKGDLGKAAERYEEIIERYSFSELTDNAYLRLAGIYERKGDFVKARELLSHIVENFPQSNLIHAAMKEMGDVNIALLFSPSFMEDSVEYTVKGGDSLFIIAQNFGTTVDLIKKSNNLSSDFLRPGDKLKVITEKFSVVVDKSKNTLMLKLGERLIKMYPVGTGTAGSTPAGEFTITNKIANPPWHKPGEGAIPFGDPRNELGTRWMGFDLAGYGIHGTWQPETVGYQASAGCIRMLNEDVEELFQIVPVGTEVTVVE